MESGESRLGNWRIWIWKLKQHSRLSPRLLAISHCNENTEQITGSGLEETRGSKQKNWMLWAGKLKYLNWKTEGLGLGNLNNTRKSIEGAPSPRLLTMSYRTENAKEIRKPKWENWSLLTWELENLNWEISLSYKAHNYHL